MEKLEDGSERVVLSLPPFLAPIKVAILPLVKKDGMPEKAREIIDMLKYDFMCFYEEKDTIGKRYRRQDAIGTPFCIAIDNKTMTDGVVTIRERDSRGQMLDVKIEDLKAILTEKLDWRKAVK